MIIDKRTIDSLILALILGTLLNIILAVMSVYLYVNLKDAEYKYEAIEITLDTASKGTYLFNRKYMINSVNGDYIMLLRLNKEKKENKGIYEQ